MRLAGAEAAADAAVATSGAAEAVLIADDAAFAGSCGAAAADFVAMATAGPEAVWDVGFAGAVAALPVVAVAALSLLKSLMFLANSAARAAASFSTRSLAILASSAADLTAPFESVSLSEVALPGFLSSTLASSFRQGCGGIR